MDGLYRWRALLGELVSDPQERQRIANVMGINPVTILRWVTNKSSPRAEKLRQLLDVFPRHREQLFTLLLEEYPELLTYEQEPVERLLEIPPAFYARVLATFANSPIILRTSSIRSLILQQMIVHFDPLELGIVIAIVQCMPPALEQKVRSLRLVIGRSTLPSGDWLERQTLFLGAESQTGHAVRTGRLISIQSYAEKSRLFTIHPPSGEDGSAVACPILKADYAAGCLYISVPRQNYFTQQHLDLIKCYANLLILAFEDSEFYSLEDIDLGIMPPRSKQLPLLTSFQRRVTDYLIRCQTEDRLIRRPQAEQIIWKEIEEELLHISFSSENDGHDRL